ncbi:MAG: insulinase family protein [Burkholderiales bacterium]|nr:insulinase family protein [Burkholderiales bacterium]
MTRFLAWFILPMTSAYSFASSNTPTLPPGVRAGPIVEGVASYTLDNGLRVLLFPDDSKPTTTVNITYLVGSRHESYGETGMAHLLEHLLFKGTKTRENIFEELGRRGMRFNGSTYFDRTNYYETFTADDEALAWSLKMEADRMVNANIWRSDLDSEMTVVRNEFENWENNPQLVLWGKLQATAFDWHNYGNLTIGARSDIENVDIDRLRAFYQNYYQPDNAILIVSGKFVPEKTLTIITDAFGKISKPTRALPKLYTQEPVQEGERRVTVRRRGGTPWLAMLFHTVSGPNPESVAIEALGEIMSLAPSGRLYRALVAEHIAGNVETWSFSLADPGMSIFWAQLAPQDAIAPVEEQMFKTLYDIENNPISDDEVKRVRARAIKDFNHLLRDPERFAIALSESIAQGDWRLFFIQRDLWRNLTTQDVQNAALRYLKPSNVTVGQYLPLDDAALEQTRAPSSPNIDIDAMVRNYKGNEGFAAGETFDASSANLEARTKRSVVREGLVLALLPKKTRGEAVHFNLRLDWGNADNLRSLATVGRLTADMISLGTQQHDRQAFEDAIDQLEARLSINGDATGVYITGETVREHLAALLSLTAEALRAPAFSQEEFDKLIREQFTRIEADRTDPQAIASLALRRYTRPYDADDVRYVASFDEEIAQLKKHTVGDLKKFHQRFYSATHGELAIVGDFSPDEILPIVNELFADWRNETPYARIEDAYRQIKAKELRTETPDKANAFLIGSLAMPLNDQHPDFAALMVGNQLLGASTESRLPNRLRTQDGLSYSVGSALQPGTIDANTRFVVYAIFAPQNLTRVQQGFREVLTQAVSGEPSNKEIDDAKLSLLQERQIARAQDKAQASSLVSQLYLDRTWKESDKLDKAIAAVTAADVARVLKKYLVPDQIVYSIAGDFENAKSTPTP